MLTEILQLQSITDQLKIQIVINEIMHSHKGNAQYESCYEYKIMWT